MANRSPRRLLGRRPPGSLRPKRWLPPHAGREGKAGPEVQGGKPLVRPEAGGAGSNRRPPGRAPKSLPSGCWSGPGPTHGPKRRRRRSSRPLRRGGSGLWEAEAAAGGGRGRRRARGRARGAGRSVGDAPARRAWRALPRARLTWGEAGSLRANGERRRQPVPTPAHVGPSQSGGGQLRHSWDTLSRSRALSVCSCWGKRKELGCGQPGSGDLAPSAREGSGWLWEALLRRDFGWWIPSLYHISCSQCCEVSRSLSLWQLCGVASSSTESQLGKQTLRVVASNLLVPLLKYVTMGSFLQVP